MASNGSEDQHGEVENVPPTETATEDDPLLARVNAYLGEAGNNPSDPTEVHDAAENASRWEKQAFPWVKQMSLWFDEEMRLAKASGAAQAIQEVRRDLQSLAERSTSRTERLQRELDGKSSRIAALTQELAAAEARTRDLKAQMKMIGEIALNDLP